MTTRTSPSSESMRACSSAWIVGGTTISPSPPCSRTIASISSTKSGLPADAAVMRSRRSASRAPSPSRFSMSAPHSSSPSGSSRTERRVQLAAAPARPLVEQLRARDAEEEDRRVAREVGDVLDEVDEDGLGPLQVVDDDDLRSLGGARLEQPAERELRLGRRAADDRVGLDADRDQDLDERPVRDPLAIARGSAREGRRPSRRRARGSRRRGATCRSRPGRASVKSWQVRSATASS